MNFFKNAVYVLVFINLVSLGFNGWMYKELHEPDIILASDPALQTLIQESRARDTHILKAVLLTHHRLGIHPPTQQDMCPACEEMKKQLEDSPIKSIKTVQN
jgi:hypothetical protein|tara:strand:+ start:2094 stop:2399 length:306 start_codon:yes stop_codon:yes gene_type:complete